MSARLLAALAVAAIPALRPPPPAEAQTRLVVISGLAGEPKYAESFHAWSGSLVDAARSRYGVADSSIVWLAEDPGKAPGRIAGKSTKENVERTLDGLATRMRAGDQLVVVLIGHGSVQGDGARLTLPGPDLGAADLARALTKHGSRRVAVVVAASSSGDFVKALSGPGRVIITATKSGFERNESLFGGHFVAAFAGEGADADKDGRVSLLEAFTYATREVRRVYEQENRLLTEHALLDDNGDGAGSGEVGGAAKDGALARAFFLTGPAAAAAAASNDPRAVALRKEKEQLESKIEALKARKDAMDAKAYEAELERLLLDLAATTRALRALEGRTR
ncbi:MAG: hypothetical protein ABR499_03400 [Gemmatimonadaceae bacterium]